MIKPFERVYLSEKHSGRQGGDRKKSGHDNQGSGAPPGPPGDDELQSRADALEKALPEIRERIVRVETKLDGIEKNMATKTDLGELRVSMIELKTCVIEGFNIQTKWLVATTVVLAGIAFTTACLIH